MDKETLKQKTLKMLRKVVAHDVAEEDLGYETLSLEILSDLVELATAEEREACAKTCENVDAYEAYEPEVRQECADAIRARSEP